MADCSELSRVDSWIENGLAVICIDHPPVNAGNRQIRQGILDALDAIDTRQVHAVILTGNGDNLMAGADLREMEQPAVEPGLPTVTGALAAFPLPVIAVVKGYTLGGGLELALACDYRLATSGAILGLPEVSVGVIPGAGGTQRLPRIVGLPAALEMIATGKPIKAARALELGLVDRLLEAESDESLQAQINDFAVSVQQVKRPVSERNVNNGHNDISGVEGIGLLVDRLIARSKNQPSVIAATEAVLCSASMSFDEGLAAERKLFLGLRDSESAKAMRYQFFAERQPVTLNTEVPATPVYRVAVIGAGTMGSGIAYCALVAGYDVTLIEQSEAALAAGKSRIQRELEEAVKREKLSAEQRDAILQQLTVSQNLDDVGTADLVIEAIIEDLPAKQALFSQLSDLVSTKAILASNTSYLNIDDIAKHVVNPERVLGLHFFSPASRMLLLEIVQTQHTDDATLAAGTAFVRKLKKKGIVVRNARGFVGNRIYAAYRRQCEFMLEEGASPEQIDRAVEAYGFAMGPFKVADMSGLDIAWRMRQQESDTRHLRRYVAIPDLLCEANRLGRKTGKGYYAYPNGKPESDPEVAAIISQYRAAQAVQVKTFSDSEIQQRVVNTLINEALLLIEEGVCQRPEDIDIALVNGYGFPRWRGGPVFIARQMSQPELTQRLEMLRQVSGEGHQSARAELLPNNDLEKVIN